MYRHASLLLAFLEKLVNSCNLPFVPSPGSNVAIRSGTDANVGRDSRGSESMNCGMAIMNRFHYFRPRAL